MTTRLITVASVEEGTEALTAAISEHRWADASNLVSDAHLAAKRAAEVDAALAEMWAQHGPTGDARGWPVALDTPTPVNVPRRAERQVDDRWGAVA